MNATLHRNTKAQTQRLLAALLVTTALLHGSIGPVRPAHADEPIVRDHRDPAARVQLVIKRITVHDDMDWGAGDINISFTVRTHSENCSPGDRECGQPVAEGSIPQFSATDGSVKQLDRVVPAAGDSLADSSITPELGIPIRPGQWYGVTIFGVEADPTSDDILGQLDAQIADQDGHIRFGAYTERGVGRCEKNLTIHPFCGIERAAFSVEYEIRPAPLPDLRPIGFRIASDQPGGRDDLVCFTVLNRGVEASGPFQVSASIDGAVPVTFSVGASGLAAGQSREQCTSVRLPGDGGHRVALVVDRDRAVAEMDETNNVYERLLLDIRSGAAGPLVVAGAGNIDQAQPGGGTLEVIDTGTWTGSDAAGSEPRNVGQSTNRPATTKAAPSTPTPSAPVTPTATPGAGLPDLTVSAIKVNGQVPDGKDDCKDGKNAVSVVVKNTGPVKASGFSVRLTADGAEIADESVAGLAAGQEREVRFGEVRLKKGEHQLTASVVSEGSVVESHDGNNARSVTASCRAGA